MTDQPMAGEPRRGPGRPPKATLPDTVTPMPDAPEGAVMAQRHVLNDPPKAVMIPVQLLKHYRPLGMDFTIVKDVPPPLPGIASDYKNKAGDVIGRKLWAGTVVELPALEARRLLGNVMTTMEPVPGPDGKPMRNREGDVIRQAVKSDFPLAKRMDPLPDERAA